MTSCRRSIAPSTFGNWPGSVARSCRGIFVSVSNATRCGLPWSGLYGATAGLRERVLTLFKARCIGNHNWNNVLSHLQRIERSMAYHPDIGLPPEEVVQKRQYLAHLRQRPGAPVSSVVAHRIEMDALCH